MKVVLLAGGQGTRIREESEFKPKPMIPIGERPIIWHIMKIYSQFGFNEFVICLGYKGYMIKDYFLNFEVMNSDFTVKLGKGIHHDIEIKDASSQEEWEVTLADTGLNAMTGARLARVRKYIDSDIFMMTYGDGVANINIDKLLDFHSSHGKIATVTGVSPPSRFGDMNVANDAVTSFAEKAQNSSACINGGFFVCDRRVFDYVSEEENCIFEKTPLEQLAQNGELMMYRHTGFWQCMDTLRDMTYLNTLSSCSPPPWFDFKE